MALLVACLLGTAGLGCGSGDSGPALFPVSGTITVDGAPLAGAGISFRPDVGKGNKFAEFIPSGTADDQGEYELVTAARKGAPPGWYKVVVFAPSPPMARGEAPQVGPPPFNPKYSDPDQTDLSIEVTRESAPDSYDLKLTK